jgi:amino acid adenylation domain-containing protein
MQPVPVGVRGELYIGGDGVARGYWNRGELTAERFVPDPFHKRGGQRLYRTGDEARYLENGEIEYLGRSDQQVKLRGFRIELGEIEAALREHESVSSAAVAVRGERLVAYVVGETIDGNVLREHLQQRLPDYMVPSYYMTLAALPQTPNGKLDRKALPTPEPGAAGAEYEAPRTPVEEVLSAIVAEVLQLPQVGRNDEFFTLGGHSLLAMQVISRIREAFQVELPVRMLFETPTLSGLARKIGLTEAKPEAPPLNQKPRDGALPLSFAQQRLWFLDQLEPGSPVYNIPAAVRLTGQLNISALEQTFDEVLRRHESLRTRFSEVNGRAVQIIDHDLKLTLSVEDVHETEVDRITREEAQRPFDLSQSPLLRARLLRLKDDEHVLLLTIHHIVGDEWSMGVLVRVMATLYGAQHLKDLSVQYADYALWQREWLQGEFLASEIDYWRRQLHGIPVLDLPTDRPRPPIQTSHGARYSFEISPELFEAVDALSREQRVTRFMTLLAAFQTLLHRYSSQDDIVIGTPVAGRNHVETENLIGLFVNTLVLRGDLSGDPDFSELLRRVRDTAFAAYAHDDVPFEKLVEQLQPERDLSRTPLFQVLFVLQNDQLQSLEVPGLKLDQLPVDTGTAKFDLLFAIVEEPHGLRGSVEYNTDLFDHSTIERMASHFQNLLASIVNDPAQRISQLEMLSAQEREQLLEGFHAEAQRKTQRREEESLSRLFEIQVEKTPAIIALTFENESLTYAELNSRANQLAHRLRKLGVGPESMVGICMERSVEMVVGLLGIIKAGAAYVPLDPEYPEQRLAYMMDDAQLSVLLTQQRWLDEVPVQCLTIALDAESFSAESAENPAEHSSGEQLAYCIYTSGSTGQPKGALNTHAGICNRLLWMQDTYGLSEHDRVLQKTSFSFDVSVWEFFWPLLTGARLVLARPGAHRDNAELVRLVQQQQITTMHFVPSMLQVFLETEGVEQCESLQRVICSGEALSYELQQRFYERLGPAELHNLYGPTEAAVDVSWWACERDSETGVVPIGRAISNTQLYILDRHLQPVPVGVHGELYIGGVQLARGYWRRPELTAEKFVPHPFSAQGERLYRTGDLTCWQADGNIRYLGRLDQQVKIKGFRIELGEIETALSLHEAVRECVVMAREDLPGDKQLTAYVVAQPEQSPNVSELRSYLKQKLPEYMIPASFVLLSELPLTQNGKLDRRALPAPHNVRPKLANAYVAPETAVEKNLARIWSEVLHLDRVGVHDSFFALGGDSIRSIEVRSRAEQSGIRLSLQQLFQYQTISELSQQLNGASVKPPAEAEIGPWSLVTDADRRRVPDGIEDAYPLAMLQAGMLFYSEYAAGVATYHDVFSFHVRAPFDEDALGSAVEELMLRHAVLRTSFDVSSFSEPMQLVHTSAPVPLAVDDLAHLEAGEQEDVISAWLSGEGKTRFDWTRPPLFRLQVHRRSEETFQFSLSFHHAILDGWSVASMLTELFQLYMTRQSELPSGTNYRDFVALERQAIHSTEARDYWSQKLEGAVSNRLPRWTSRNENLLQESRAQVLAIPIAPDVFDGLKQVAQSVSAPLKSVLLAAHLRVLSLLSGQSEVVTGLVSNGRPEQSGAERTLGLFLNTLPVRINLRGGTWEDLIRQTFEIEKEMLQFRWYPLASMQQQRAEALFETGFIFNHFHVYEQLRNLDGIEVLDENIFEQTNFPLGTIFSLDRSSSQLQLQLNYNAAELAAEQVNAIADYYLETLRRIVAQPTAHYESICLLTQQEQRRLLVQWNETKAEFPDDLCVHQWFESQVERTPEAVALICEGEQMTFRQLNERANQLAHRLQRLGVGPDSLVGICLERSLDLIAGLLGILKAGAAYVPLDPAYPRDRLQLMLEDAGAQIVVTPESLHELDSESTANCRSNVSSANLAYVIYTSGSTGRPKGVMISHNGVCNTLRWRQVAFSLSEKDRILQTISIAFDPSVWQIFGSLVTGSCLVLAKPGGDKDISYLLKLFREQAITIADFVPSMLQVFLDQQPGDACRHLRHVFCGGEVLSAELLDQYFASMPGQIHNMYGPTEGTIDAACWTCEPLQDVSIGRPVANKKIYLLDEHLQPAPTGVPGHLHIGGVGLARGYLHQPQLSAEKLIPDPFSTEPGAVLYRTGDLARYLPDGRLEFLGRMDQQVKVRGFRIELEEIETALASHETVQAVVVVARERAKGEKELVAYVVGDNPVVSELRAYLRQRLPEYMVPAYFVVLDQLPLTPNGKLDRLALPAPSELRPQTETVYLAPRNELEKRLAQVWQETLELDQVGVHDNFFDLGGHSLLMLRIQGKVRTLFNRDLSIVEMFRYPTISSMAELLDSEPQKKQSFEESQERAAVARAATRRRRELRKSQPVA